MVFSVVSDFCKIKTQEIKGEKVCTKVILWNLAGRTLTVDIGRVAKQANGAALMHYGDTTVLIYCNSIQRSQERESISSL